MKLGKRGLPNEVTAAHTHAIQVSETGVDGVEAEPAPGLRNGSSAHLG